MSICRQKSNFILLLNLVYCLGVNLPGLCAQQSIPPSSFKIVHYGVEDGLSQGSVYSMLKDSRNFMWFTSLEGLNRFDGHHFRVYAQNEQDSTALRGTASLGLVEDPHGNIWTGTEVCLNLYRRLTDDFDFVYAENEKGQAVPATHYPFYADSTEVWYTNNIEGIIAYNFERGEKRIISDHFLYQGTSSIINSTLMGANGKIWIRDWQGLASLDPSTGQIKYYFSTKTTDAVGPPTTFTCHRPASDGTVWLGRSGGLVHLDPASEQWTFYPINSVTSISEIRQAPDGLLYLGTNYSGLYLFRPEEGVVGHLTSENTIISGSSVPTIYIDEEGLVWINTDPNGIDLLFPGFNGFKRFGEVFFESLGFSSAGIRCFAEAPNGNIWVGTNKDGVFVFDPEQKKLLRHLSPFGVGGNSENHASFILFDSQDRIWAGTYYGLFLSEDGNTFRRVDNTIPFSFNHPSHEFWDMKETPEGYFFITTSNGLFYIPTGETRAYPVNGFEGVPFGDIEQFGRYILLSKYGRAVSVFDYKEWLENGRGPVSVQEPIDQYNIKHFAPQGDSLLWLATNKGVLKTRPSENFKKIDILSSYTRNEGLASDYVYGLLWDDIGSIWMSTNRGIAQLDPESGFIKTYGLDDNIQGYEFNTNSFLKNRRGTLFFGGTQGFNQFDPPLDGNPALPSIQFTGLHIEGQPNYDGPYIGELDQIELRAGENTFEPQFVAIDYWSRGRNRYRVRLREYEQDWVELEEGRIRYTQVPPGQYVFEVLASNGEGQWTTEPRRLKISVAVPWYRSIWAYLSILLISFFIVYQIYQFRQRRRALRQKLLMEQLEAERLKELDEVKNRFFTNITHEFRTPLTVLLGLTQEIEQNPSVKLQQRLQLIRKNGQNLLELVNQLLDLARIDEGKLQLKMVKDDLISFIRMLVDSFHSYALAQKIGLQFYSELEEFEMDFDPNLLQRILTNLLSNAFQFTPEYGKVLVVAKLTEKEGQAFLEIKVKDNGEGIASEKIPYVFDRFYTSSPQQKKNDDHQQMQQGAGIGLALVKELIELMNGEISVKSQTGKGTTFAFVLPVTRLASSPESNARPRVHTDWVPHLAADLNLIREDENKELPMALLIEDNADVLYYLQTCLGQGWRIQSCQNGLTGVTKAIELIPDVIVTDVMMPGIDGFEVVKRLKADERTSHIPILMLTAKAKQADKLEGLATGADAYLIKPFDKKELLLRLENFLQMRARLQAHLLGDGQSSDTAKPEQQFLKKINNIILQHLDENAFNTHLLTREVGMSRSQLYRKVRALTGQSLSRYMRSFRLKQARQLLRTTELSVSEVAWKTGFDSLSWFDQAYQEEFGESPSDTRK